jgi:hypothetical protein
MCARAPGACRMRAVAPGGERCALYGECPCRRPDAAACRDLARRAGSSSRPVPAAVGAQLQAGALDTQPSGAVQALGRSVAHRAAPGARTEERAARDPDAPASRQTSNPSSRAARQATTTSNPHTTSLGAPDSDAADARTARRGSHAAAGGTIGWIERRRRRKHAATDHHGGAVSRPPRGVRPAHAFAASRRSHTVAESLAESCEGTPSADSITPHTRPSRVPRRPGPSAGSGSSRSTPARCRRAAQNCRS